MSAPSNNTNIKAALGRLLTRFLDTVCVKYAAEAEKRARANAPWTDRTGDARKLIKGIVLNDEEVIVDKFRQDDKGKTSKSGTMTINGKGCIGIALVHRVEYGKYLETANSGKHAVLKPTIEGIRAEFLNITRQTLGGKSR